MEQLNGFELAGRPMKVGNVTEHNPETSGGSYYDVDDMDRAGFGLGATGRIQLMAKLAEGKMYLSLVCRSCYVLVVNLLGYLSCDELSVIQSWLLVWFEVIL